VEVREHVRLLRRRWYFLVLGAVAAAIVGFATAPGAGSRPVTYEATNTLLTNPNAVTSITLDQAALLVTTGAVPQEVADDLGSRGSVTAVPDLTTQSLTISARGDAPAEAEELANAYTDTLLESLNADATAAYELSLETAQAEVDAAAAEVTALEQQLRALPPTDPDRVLLEAQLQAAASAHAAALENLSVLEAQGVPAAPLEVIEREAADQVEVGGVTLPDAKVQRALLLGAFGLLLGIGGAIAADRLETRIRGKDDAESAFGVPVIAEIPPLPGRRQGHELFAVTRPSIPLVEAYRSLRTVVLYNAATAGRPEHLTNGHNPDRKVGAAQHADHESQVVLITSPGAGEGKTTTSAHLAALLAEVGKTVLVVSADFRRPQVHEYFGTPREPGLSDVLTGQSELSLGDLDMQTTVPGVRLLPSGSPVTNPSPFLRETAQLIAAARKVFDYVIIDTAPLLVANDATELAGVADTVIVLARADRTTRDAARRAMEVLERVEAPVLGAVVIAANDTPTAYSYYRNRYYTDSGKDGDSRPDQKPRIVPVERATLARAEQVAADFRALVGEAASTGEQPG
jgi:capsular exopolysaccharide synthesis family protein